MLEYIPLATVIILLVILFILFSFYRSKRKANFLLKQQRVEIELKNQELASLEQAKSRFFANISHDLRTPLTLISLPLESVIRQLSDRPEVQKEMKLMQKNAQKLRAMVDDLFEVSTLDSIHLNIKPRPIAIRALLDRITNDFSSFAQHLQINYQTDLSLLPEDYLSLDRRMFEKVINNLLCNALKYTRKGGLVKLSAIKEKNRLLIQVIDNGVGIAPEDLPKIFDRHFQSQESDARIQEGTGIGLAIVKEYTRIMGGEITVNSTLGKGSTFTVDIPYTRVDREVHQVVEQEEEIATHEENENLTFIHTTIDTSPTFKILIVEDSYEMQQFLKKQLQLHYEVSVASQGLQALKHLANHEVDLIVTDAMMPEMDGFELLRRLRQDEKYISLPVIMLTALNDETNRIQALSIGVDDYLAKPFSSKELLTRVAIMLIRGEGRKTAAMNSTEEDSETSISGNPMVVAKGDQSFLRKVEKLILSELENEEFRLESAAEQFHVTDRQFRNRMRKITGLSPKQYQREVALQKAKQLLEDDIYDNLTAVAYSVGIRNTTRFAKYYDKRFGKDPRTYFFTD